MAGASHLYKIKFNGTRIRRLQNKKTPAPRSFEPPKRTHSIVVSKWRRHSEKMAPTLPKLREAEGVTPQYLLLHELSERCCRWPYGDGEKVPFTFCGSEVAYDIDGKRLPYCRGHTNLAYDPRKRKELA